MHAPIGQDEVVNRFAGSLCAGKLHHAWLLYGLKGIGKRTLAEHLAGLVMCDQHSHCGDCHACRMLLAGSHPDLFRVALLEGKRDLNIDQVRELLSFLALSGAEGGRRVVILDDAERMNHQAANALLKGLEEPSPGSLLLMVCSDIERLPATIRSRCMLQSCAPLSQSDVRAVVADWEPGVASAQLDLAVQLADGSPGAVIAMQQPEIAAALEEWQHLMCEPARLDIGSLEVWVRKHLNTVPHGLIARIAVREASELLQHPVTDARFDDHQQLCQAVSACLRWPGDVVRHSLRAGPALLACLLQLRAASRQLGG